MQLLTDNPITPDKHDAFGFKSYAKALKKAILQAEPLPLCVGILGAWGSGKSSFMYLLKGLIEEDAKEQSDEKIETIWFNPWKYDQKEDLWNALIQTILNSIIAAQTIKPEIKETAKNLALATTWLALKKTIPAITAGVISAENLDKIVEAFNKKDEKYYRHINTFEENFTEVVKDFTNNGKLVVFIDDLDRCLPENAITVLESLKLFIGNAHCIFVLGMDHSLVEAGIKIRYGEKTLITGRDYLDKIIQVPFFLPPVLDKNLRDSLPRDEDFPEEIWDIIRLGMGGNPRKTRRFVNSFSLLRSFLNQPAPDLQKQMKTDTFLALSQTEQNMHLARLLVFQISFPDFYQQLYLSPGDWMYLYKFVIEADAKERDTTLKEREELRPFWEDKALRAFISNTSGDRYKGVPRGEVVELLLQATSLVQTTSPTSEV
jgi:energy-coupling factor transporter ATP-binding protein EcfA2